MPTLFQALKNEQTIFIDTALFIYYFEQSEKFSQITTELFSALDDNSINAVTSAITLTEILIKPYQ